MRLPRIPPSILAILVAGALTAAATVLVLMNPPGAPILPYEVSLAVDGSLVVGMDVSFSATVRDRFPTPPDEGYLFLSMPVTSSFEILSEVGGEDPWNLPDTWNLTGMNLTNGRVFALNATPVWAAEQVLGAFVWSPENNDLPSVRFEPNSSVPDLFSVNVKGLVSLRLTTLWPLNVQLTVDGNLNVGSNATLRIRVEGGVSGPRAPQLLFLSIELGPSLSIVSTNYDDDPWFLPAVWNLTGMDLSVGAEFSLVVAFDACWDWAVGLGAWSPRTNWTDVQLDQRGSIQNLESIRLWASQTIELPLC